MTKSRNCSVSTVNCWLVPDDSRAPLTETKKNDTSRRSGPPRLIPRSCRKKSSFASSKNVLARRSLFRWRNMALPRSSLVPPRVTRLRAAPELRPNSTDALLAMTSSSSTASLLGAKRTVPPQGPLLMLRPSTSALLAVVRCPPALKVSPCSCARKSLPPGSPMTPGCSVARCRGFRPAIGRSAIRRRSATYETSARSVWMSDEPGVTRTSRAIAPGAIVTSRPSVAPTDTLTSGCATAPKPVKVTVTE
jgi:hypothetical protein